MPKVDLLENFLPRINEDMALSLEHRPSLKEITATVWCCDSSKAADMMGSISILSKECGMILVKIF